MNVPTVDLIDEVVGIGNSSGDRRRTSLPP